MNNEYVIINKTKVLEEIEELKASLNYIPESYVAKHLAQIYTYEQVVLRSTPLIPEIKKAYNYGVLYSDSNKTSNDYISNLKLDI